MASPRLDDDYKQNNGQESLCSSVRMRDPTAGRAIASRTAIVERRPVQDPIRSWTYARHREASAGRADTARSLRARSRRRRTKNRQSACRSVRAADRRRRTLLENQKRRRASQNARYRDAASFKKTHTAKRPHQKKNLKQQNRNTTDKTAHPGRLAGATLVVALP